MKMTQALFIWIYNNPLVIWVKNSLMQPAGKVFNDMNLMN